MFSKIYNIDIESDNDINKKNIYEIDIDSDNDINKENIYEIDIHSDNIAPGVSSSDGPNNVYNIDIDSNNDSDMQNFYDIDIDSENDIDNKIKNKNDKKQKMYNLSRKMKRIQQNRKKFGQPMYQRKINTNVQNKNKQYKYIKKQMDTYIKKKNMEPNEYTLYMHKNLLKYDLKYNQDFTQWYDLRFINNLNKELKIKDLGNEESFICLINIICSLCSFSKVNIFIFTFNFNHILF